MLILSVAVISTCYLVVSFTFGREVKSHRAASWQRRTNPVHSPAWISVASTSAASSGDVTRGMFLTSNCSPNSIYVRAENRTMYSLGYNGSCEREESFSNEGHEEKVGDQGRRGFVGLGAFGLGTNFFSFFIATPAARASINPKFSHSEKERLMELFGPDTYPALAYSPLIDANANSDLKLPLIVVIHGAGKNEQDVWNLANIRGEHSGLIPSLLAAGNAPTVLSENFLMVAPYSYRRRSFYEDPRQNLLRFVDWICSEDGQQAAGWRVPVDINRIFLFGFSDGATLGVELMTTGRFAAGIFAAYGFTGTLPDLALNRLKDLPIWIFHSADDVIFPVACSDKLVQSLRNINTREELIRYTRYDEDQEGFTGAVRGHSTGITASKNPEVYKWLLSL